MKNLRDNYSTILLFSLFITIPLIIFSALNEQSSRQQATAQGVQSPSFYPLAPCPSCAEPSVAKMGEGDNPEEDKPEETISQNPQAAMEPCEDSAVTDNRHKRHHKRHHGKISGGMEEILQFLIELINKLIELLGGSPISSPEVSQQPNEPDQPQEQPDEPDEPKNEPVQKQPCAEKGGQTTPSGGATVPSTAEPSTAAVSQPAANPSGTAATGGTGTGNLGLTDVNTCTNPAKDAGVRASIPKPNCTINATDANGASAAKSGDVVCFTGNLSGRLKADKPGVTYFGGGTAMVGGIDATGEGATVQGFVIQNATAPGIEITGKNITIVDNKVVGPTKGGDNDGMRFFGEGLKIVHNTISNIKPEGSQHADCMQSFTSGKPTTTNTIIDSNRCESIANIGIIMEGPNSGEGDGSCQGKSENITIINNYFQTGASNTVFLDDVHNAKIINNDSAGKNDGTWGFEPSKNGAEIKCNTSQAEVIDPPRGGAKCSAAGA